MEFIDNVGLFVLASPFRLRMDGSINRVLRRGVEIGVSSGGISEYEIILITM